MSRRRIFQVTCVIALIVGILLWNLIFDLWLGQAERQYLWQQSRADLGLARRVSLKGSMDDAVRWGALTATVWTALVVGAIFGVAWLASRAAGVRSGARLDARSGSHAGDR